MAVLPVYPDIDLHTASAPDATLTFVLASLPMGMGLVLPSLWRSFAAFQRTPVTALLLPRQVG